MIVIALIEFIRLGDTETVNHHMEYSTTYKLFLELVKLNFINRINLIRDKKYSKFSIYNVYKSSVKNRNRR